MVAFMDEPHNKRMQPDFGELALASAADARRYATIQSNQIENL